jgi:adenylate kinase
MKYRTFLILGPPGSGKATHAQTLGSVPRFHHISSSDVFRTLETRTPVGQAFLEYASRGEFVPGEVSVKLWLAHIAAEANAHAFKPDIDALVLDAIPRDRKQAQLLEDHLDIQMLFYLDVPDRAALVARVIAPCRRIASATLTRRLSRSGWRCSIRIRNRCWTIMPTARSGGSTPVSLQCS